MLSVLLITDDGTISGDEIETWMRSCIVSSTPWWSLTGYLRLDLAATNALVDVIAFLPADHVDGFIEDYAWRCLWVIEQIRALPESCCMRDGRKWKKVPCVVLAQRYHLGSVGPVRDAGVPIAVYSPQYSSVYFRLTLGKLQEVVNDYQERVLSQYQKVGILVACEHGRCQVKWALEKKAQSLENEYYHSSADRRKLKTYITVHRDVAGIEYEARLFEELINDPKTRERDLHRFFEQHPAFLMDAMRGVPISHQPRLAKPKDWTPDFALPPAAVPPGSERSVQLAELKGVHVPLLTGQLHRGFSHNVMSAINQVRDYARVMREGDPANVKRLVETFGYVPDRIRKAVLIGRVPKHRSDAEIVQQRMGEQPDVQIVPYDEILHVQHRQINPSWW